jgi:hypothetical protein
MKEVDLLIEHQGILYPIEVKKTASIKNLASKHFDCLKNLKTSIGRKAFICFVDSPCPVSKEIDAIPVGYI